VDGPVELGYHAWEVDRFGKRRIIPYNIKLFLEGIPQFAWVREVAEKVVGDEALIYQVEEVSLQGSDIRTFNCWALSEDPSRIPQVVFLSLLEHEDDLRRSAQIHLSRPRSSKNVHVFCVLVHIEVVEDLLFYNYPKVELIEDGKIPWRDFCW
jgi:hypothetical protein